MSLDFNQAINIMIPGLLKKIYRSVFPVTKKYGWFGNYKCWDEAMKHSKGYNANNILKKVKHAVLKVKNGEAVYERDSVLFDKIQYSQPLLDTFKLIADEYNLYLNVIDFGGSLGSSYFQNRNFLSHLKSLTWNVVEQTHFVACGNEFIKDDHLQFYNSIDDALKNNPAQVLFLSSVLQYLEMPYVRIKEFLNYNFKYIIIDRTAFIEGEKDRLTVQKVPPEIYNASYPSWFFSEHKFVTAFLNKYELLSQFDSTIDPAEEFNGKWTYRKGFLFKLKNNISN